MVTEGAWMADNNRNNASMIDWSIYETSNWFDPYGEVIERFLGLRFNDPDNQSLNLENAKHSCKQAGYNWNDFEAIAATAIQTQLKIDEIRNWQETWQAEDRPNITIITPKNGKTPFKFTVKTIENAKDRGHITAKDLMLKKFKPTVYYIDQILTEGMGFLAGSPKVGKSLLALQALYCIASGQDFMGYKTKKTKAAYYSLENKEKQDYERLVKMFDKNGTEDLHFFRNVPSFSEGLIETICSDIEQFNFKVIVIDTYGQVSKDKKPGSPEYDQVVKELKQLKSITDNNEISMILVTHLKKDNINIAEAFDRIIGSTANRGGTDFNMILSKEKESDLYMFQTESRSGSAINLMLSRGENLMFSCKGTMSDLRKELAQREYESDLIILTIKALIKESPSDEWKGTSSELIDESKRLSFNIEDTPRKVGDKIRKFDTLLGQKDNILYTSIKHGNAGKIHQFTSLKISDKNKNDEWEIDGFTLLHDLII